MVRIFSGTAQRKSGAFYFPAKKGKNASNYVNKKTNLDIIIIRRSGIDNNISMARPCHHCLELMKSVNIRYCYYSNYDGNIICEKVANMISIQISNNTKKNLQYMSFQEYFPFDKNNDIFYNKYKYYETLMKKYIIGNIRQSSIEYFIQYNFLLLFPKDYYYIIQKQIITFYTNTHTMITQCNIIY